MKGTLDMNPLAVELNRIIEGTNPHLFEMLSDVGKKLFFPKGILSQGAEAKEKAHRFNATIGMATEKGRTMHLPSVMQGVSGLEPEEALTYAPSFGVPALREAWKKEIIEKNPSLDAGRISLPIVTNAITHGLSVSADMWVDPGDAIILPDKMWGNYNMIFSVRKGAEIVNFTLFTDDGGFNLSSFESCVRTQAESRDKIIVILNFPNNPTGYTPTTEEGDRIADILTSVAEAGTHVVVFTDDAYFGLFYEEDMMKESIFTRLVERHPRLLAVKLDGATKENYVWGLRVGFITYGTRIETNHGPFFDALERKTAGAVRGSISSASRLGQALVLNSMQSGSYRKEKEAKYDIMKDRAQEVKRVLENTTYRDAFEAYPFNSGYFMCLKLLRTDAEKLRAHLLDQYGIGLISLGERDLRVAFSCLEKQDTQELFDTVYQGVLDLDV
jgi:aspartate/methionine/tyrosine aminotransferase